MIAGILVAGLLMVAVYGTRLIFDGSRFFGITLLILTTIGIPLVLFPQSANSIANALGVGRGADLLVYVMFCLLVTLILVIHVLLRQVNRRLTLIVRAQALANAEPPPTKSDWRIQPPLPET